MRYTFVFRAVFLAFFLTSCASHPENPQNLNDTPDLSSFRVVDLISNSTSKRETGQARFVVDGAYIEIHFPGIATSQRLFIQVEECRNSVDPLCQRRFVLSGDLFAFASRLKCYIQIRNDANSGYLGQALQGLCQDTNNRSFAITLSR